jgi:DNA-binding response OmpR family regulator
MSTVLVYSDDASVRERVRVAVGRQPDPNLDPIDWLEAADGRAVVARVDLGDVDVCILDGEAAPEGGMGISRQLKNEIADCPAMLLLVMRHDDRWLARWSLADAVVQQPIDPVELTDALVRLLRERARRLSVPTAGELAGPH